MKQIETPPKKSSNDHTTTRRNETCEKYDTMATMCDFYPEAHILFDAESLEATISTPSEQAFEESEKNFNKAYRKFGGRFVKRYLYDPIYDTGVAV